MRGRVLLRRWLAVLVAVAALAAAYVGILVFPEPLFRHSMTAGQFTFRAAEPIDPAVARLAEAVEARLARSQIHDASVRQRIFVVNSPALWLFLNGPYRSAIARNVELGNAIFVPRLDAGRGVIVHFDGRVADAVGILAHETAHTDVGRRLGVVAVWLLPWWKKEGYAEYIGSDGLAHSEAPPRYREAAEGWRHLLDDKGWTFDQVIAAPLSLEDAAHD